MGDSGNMAEANPWDEYIERTRQYLATEKLESEELPYKHEAEKCLAVVRRALLAGEDNWADPMNDDPPPWLPQQSMRLEVLLSSEALVL